MYLIQSFVLRLKMLLVTFSPGPSRQFAPLSWVGVTACLLSAICAFLNLVRFVPLLNFINVDEVCNKDVF